MPHQCLLGMLQEAVHRRDVRLHDADGTWDLAAGEGRDGEEVQAEGELADELGEGVCSLR